MTRLATLGLALGLLIPAVQAQDGEIGLLEGTRDTHVLFGKRSVTAGSVEEKLSLPVRVALNEWAGFVAEHELQIALPMDADVMLLTHVKDRDLADGLVKPLEEGWKLLDAAHPETPRDSRCVVGIVLDAEGYAAVQSDLMDLLAERRLMTRMAASAMASDTSSLTLREAGIFIQPSWDTAGNSSAGDDEFRLGNEVLNKTAQCALAAWYGQLPETLRWGMGYVLEQRVFHSIYQFNRTGFVATEEHFGWPKKTYEVIKDRSGSDRFSLPAFVMDSSSAGTSGASQMITWGVLDRLVAEDPGSLREMLSELGALHAEAAGFRSSPDYLGDADRTQQVLEQKLGALTAKDLMRHVKRVK